MIVIPTSATEITPLRAVPELLETVKESVPPAVPECGDTVIQLTLAAAVHAHPPGPESTTVPVPPEAAKLLTSTLAENSQAAEL